MNTCVLSSVAALAVVGVMNLSAAPAMTPGKIDAADLSPLKTPNAAKGAPVALVGEDGKALPITCGSDNASYRAAEWLATAIAEMTGVKPQIVRPHMTQPKAPAIYMAATTRGWKSASPCADKAAAAAGLVQPDRAKGQFRVVTKDGSLYLLGDGTYAAYDFGERVLGIRQYFETKHGGKCVPKHGAKSLAIPALDYADEPVFPKREFWPYDDSEWASVWKTGNSHRPTLHVHTPDNWHRDTNFNYKVTNPEVLEMSSDGQRGVTEELCYGNPKTIDEYLRRMEMQLKGGRSAGGYVDAANKSITVSQADQGVNCHCAYCKKLSDEKLGASGNASPIIWGSFTQELSKRVKKLYPDWTVVTLPYINTCDLPTPDFKYAENNVEAMLCTMPGLALLKEKSVMEHEEELIRQWKRATGNKVQNWHYICWPADFTCAPYVFGETAQGHYQRMRNDISGTFINGGYPLDRLCLSAYVWCRCLWNPDFDLKALYDGFATRLFGPAAKPMRELIALQESGWNRQWGVANCSNHNVFEVSYPRQDVLKMAALFAEAKKLAAGDELILKRIAYYEGGFKQFFIESEDVASGTKFEPTEIQKVAGIPTIDGKLDDAQWKLAKGYGFVHAWKRYDSDLAKAGDPALFPSELKLVWTPNEGVTVGMKCFDKYAKTLVDSYPPNSNNETLEFFFDCSGNGAGYYQLMIDILNQPVSYVASGMKAWKLDGVKSAVARQDDGWSCEVFIPFACLKDFPGLQLPEGTAAAGKYWIGNFCRFRALRKGEKDGCHTNPNGILSFSRRYTRGRDWNADPSSYGKLQFKE